MSIQFSVAKNGEQTCSVDGIFIHSKYNPSQEAKTWITSIQTDFEPKNIIVLGCCIPYCVKFLKDRFQKSKILLLQYDTIFANFSNDCEDFFDCETFFIKDGIDDVTISESLFDYFGEEDANRTLVISYLPSEKIFPEKAKIGQKGVQKYIKKSIDVIGTRMFFSKKWFQNSIRFFKNLSNVATFERPCDKNILIAASGPTLKDSIQFIKKYRSAFFILAVSSSIKALLENSIIPDAVITTDGGYWAKKHLEILKKYPEIPILCSTESALPFFIFQMNIIPLYYSDFIQNDLFEYFISNSFNYKNHSVERNGTVTGTAINFALKFTEKKIFTVGMDLEKTLGFSHTMPNSLEAINSLCDNRIDTSEKRITKSNIFSTSLSVYKNYFSTMSSNYATRITRLCCKNNILPDLGFIKTKLWTSEEIEQEMKTEMKKSKQSGKKEENKIRKIKINLNDNKKTEKVKKYLQERIKIISSSENLTEKNEEFFKTFALGKVLLYKKTKNQNDFFQAKEKTVSELKKIAENIV